MAQEMHIDVETRSLFNLKEVGLYAYFENTTTDLWCAAFSFDKEDKVYSWEPGQECPRRLKVHIENGGIVTAWNAAFERQAFIRLLSKRYGWPIPADNQFKCTMTQALGMNIPAKLDMAGKALNTTFQKDAKGHTLMMQMCRPRKINEDGSSVWWDEPAKRALLLDYCKQDVRTESNIGERVLNLRPLEERLYLLDMAINDRGVFIDEALCNAAQYVVEETMRRLDMDMKNVTRGAVNKCTATIKLTQWVQSRGVDMDSVDHESLTNALIRDDLPEDVYRAVEIRYEGSKTSVSKVAAFLRRRNTDGRMRGNLQFYGASATGRWAARGAQLQNLTRPILFKDDDTTPITKQIGTGIEYVMTGDINLISVAYDKPLTLVADLVRSMIKATPGCAIRSADFRNIEGRIVAWLAGQEDKLDAFRAFDAGTGPDLYLISASDVYDVPWTQAKPFRQVGKVCELALGFQGGAKAFAKMSKTYGLIIGDLFEGIWRRASPELQDEVISGWDSYGKATGMNERPWMAAETIKKKWRKKNWRIEMYWSEIEEAALNAMRNKDSVFSAGRIRFLYSGSFLFCLLPSGRGLTYPYPRLKKGKTPWGKEIEKIVYKTSDNEDNPAWKERAFYGGLGVENVTQAIARDVMAEAMLRVEEAGYTTILTIHDEIIDESPLGYGSLEEYIELMVQQPEWAPGLPITAEGWEGDRYRKS